MSLLSFGGMQGSPLLSAPMFLSVSITAGPFNSLRTSDDPTPQEATVNTHTPTHTPKRVAFYHFNILTFGEEKHNYLNIDRVLCSTCVMITCKAFLLYHFPNNHCVFANYQTVGHSCLLYFPCMITIQLATKVSTNVLVRATNALGCLVPGNPQHVLSSHLPTLKMPTH